MSYFIANTLTISKDRKTYDVKGDFNNSCPRINRWCEINTEIRCLYEEVRGGGMEIRCKKESSRGLNDLIHSLDFIYEEKSIYDGDIKSYKNPFSYRKLSYLLLESDEVFLRRYKDDEDTKTYLYLKKNIKKVRKAIEDFDNMVVVKINERLDEIAKDKDRYVVKSSFAGFVLQKRRGGASTTYSIENAAKYRKYEAKDVCSNLGSCKVLKYNK